MSTRVNLGGENLRLTKSTPHKLTTIQQLLAIEPTLRMTHLLPVMKLPTAFPTRHLTKIFLGIFLLQAIGSRCFGDDLRTTAAHRLIVGWDDSVICCGPGTVAGMDSPAAVEKMVQRWKARGIQGVYWRVDEAMLPARFMTRWETKVSPGMNYLLERVDQTLHKFPVLKTLLAAAELEGIQVWAWYPTIYSNGAPPTGPGFTSAWLYENKFGTDHPEVLTIDRAGNKQFMVWEYAYPEARAAKVSEFVQFAKDYGFKRFVACLRTEAAQNQPAPKHADQFGFNAPVVAEMKQRHGVDILTDPRFDYSHPKFDVTDPMLEHWRTLRGEYLTQFYRELREGLNTVDPTIQIAVQIPGDRAGTCLGNWHLDWRTWIDEGLVNEIVVPVVLDGYEGYGARAKPADFGYIDGAVSVATVRDFVKQSKQPTARIIQAGGPMTGYHEPPPNADGWRLDAWPDLWTFNMTERWEQWHRDFAEFEHIKFIEQSFDGFPDKSDGYGGGFGDFCHRPDLRSGPGYWEVLGDGSDARPHAQTNVRRGDKGLAMKLTRAADGSANLSVRHHGRNDRSLFPFPGDTAISSGSCDLEFWMIRPDAKSGMVAYLQYDIDSAHRFDVGLYVPEGDNSTIYFRDAGENVASKATFPIGVWQRVRIHVDLEQNTYSAEIAAADSTDGKDAANGSQAAQSICRDVKYNSEHNAFNMIEFSPQGATGSELFLDDLSLRWKPSAMLQPPGQQVLVEAGFESQKPAEPLDSHWKILNGVASDIRVDNDISYGHEFQSLRFHGLGGRAKLTTPGLTTLPNDRLMFDVDLFLRSELSYVQMVPTAETISSDEVGFAIKDVTTNTLIFELRTRAGTWHYGTSEQLTDTEIPAAFDAWNHLQLTLDSTSGTCEVLIQVIGESPRPLIPATPIGLLPANTPLATELFCNRNAPRNDGPAFDNLRLTRVVKGQD